MAVYSCNSGRMVELKDFTAGLSSGTQGDGLDQRPRRIFLGRMSLKHQARLSANLYELCPRTTIASVCLVPCNYTELFTRGHGVRTS